MSGRRGLTLFCLVVAAPVLGAIFVFAPHREYRCADYSGMDPRCGPVLDADAFEECYGWSLKAAAREFRAAVDPYEVARAYSWRKHYRPDRLQRPGDLSVYWGCLNGFDITWKRGVDIEPPGWSPPPRFATPR